MDRPDFGYWHGFESVGAYIEHLGKERAARARESQLRGDPARSAGIVVPKVSSRLVSRFVSSGERWRGR